MAALILAAAFCLAQAASAQPPRGIVVVPTGKVEIWTNADLAWHAIQRPTRLEEGESVRTGAGAAAAILLSDGSKMALSENGSFAVKSAALKESTFELAAGKLKAYFAGVFSSRLSVRTPAAVCAVRGTEFEVSSDPSGKTDVKVNEGHLEVSDSKGQTAVVTEEETVSVGKSGMTAPPHLVSLSEGLEAARPVFVRAETARDATRTMLEDLRNRELKANEAQLGKDIIDAFGRRVRLEEYLLRPAKNEFQVLFLNSRSNRFDWGKETETFNSAIPDDITQVPAIVAGTFYSPTAPKNWLTGIDFYATNTVDFVHEIVTLGNPVAVNFCGYGICTPLYYPASMDHQQWLGGPGVPGGLREQFDQSQSVSGSVFTWSQKIVDNTGSLALLDQFQMDTSNAGDVTGGGCTLGGEVCFDHTPAVNNAFGGPCGVGNPCNPTANFAAFVPGVTSYPSGSSKADQFVSTTYGDGSTVSAEKILVGDKGDILDFKKIGSANFLTTGNYNLENVVGSSLFQGRNIDVVIAPEILSQKNQAAPANGPTAP